MCEYVVVIDVGDEYDWVVDLFGKFYVCDVVIVQVDFGWIVGVFDDYCVVIGVQVCV